MTYKGYEIYGCLARCETFTVDDQGDLYDYVSDCHMHDTGDTILYRIDGEDGRTLASSSSIAGIKAYIDKLAV
jgi:hypothetical protein